MKTKDFTKDFAKEYSSFYMGDTYKKFTSLEKPLQFTRWQWVLIDDTKDPTTKAFYKKSLWEHHKKAFLKMKKFLAENQAFWATLKKQYRENEAAAAAEAKEIEQQKKWDEEHPMDTDDVPDFEEGTHQ